MIDFYMFLQCTPETLTDDNIKTLKIYEEEKSYPPCFRSPEITEEKVQRKYLKVEMKLKPKRRKWQTDCLLDNLSTLQLYTFGYKNKCK